MQESMSAPDAGLPKSRQPSAVSVCVKRKLVDFAAGVFDPAPDASQSQEATGDGELDEGRDPDERQGYPDRGEHRQDARGGQVDLLADGRDLGIEGAHETYTAATTNVSPNMSMQMAPTINPVRTFLRASRRVIIARG
jgi:hypothetical protein